MDLLQAIILGIVEGVTEFLPISSTGHLILVSKLLHIPDTEFLKTFEITIQLGAILAVVVLYWKKLFLDWEIMKRIAIALIPALGVGFVFYSFIRTLLGSGMTVVMALFIGGIIIILFELLRKEKEGDLEDIAVIPYKKAFFIGLFQALSVIPGVSRAGATILGGLFLGLKREAIVEFSFLLAVPTMVAATALDIVKHPTLLGGENLHVFFVGFVVSFLVAIGAIRFLLRFVKTHTFVAFGIYRMIIALLFFFLVL
jgi:undecaprenyl-diphosphatase